jgi:hypothetical protein
MNGKCTLVLAALLLSCSAVRAGETASPTDAAALVRRLGDDEFEIRTQAAQRLTEMGKAAEAALREGLKSDDAEIRRECRWLLKLALRSELEVALDAYLADGEEKHFLKLKAWEPLRQVIGADAAARSFFVAMACSEPDLLEKVGQKESVVEEQLTQRCVQLLQSLRGTSGTRATISLEQVAVLLYVAGDPGLTPSAQVHNSIHTLLLQPGPRTGLETNTAARKLLVRYFQRRTDPAVQNQNLTFLSLHNITEGADWALKLAKDKEATPETRATAIEAVGRLGGKRYQKEVEAFLDDTAVVGTFTIKSHSCQTEVRDVALAALVQLTEQKLTDYPFPYPQACPNLARYVPRCLGFAEEKDRETALKQWKASAGTMK